MDTTITAEAIREVERIVRDAETNRVSLYTIEGETFVHGTVSRPAVKFDPAPGSLNLSTLQGFADFVMADADEAFTKGRKRFVLITSPTTVSYGTGAHGGMKARSQLALASAVTPNLTPCIRPLADAIDPRVKWSDPETFAIHVAALFENTTKRADLLALLGAIEWSQAQTTADDGFTTVYSTRVGIKLGEAVTGGKTVARNPWTLAPFRTFAGEIDQPEALFILRTRGGGPDKAKEIALFEVGDGLWQRTAMDRIGSFLRGALGNAVPVFG